MKPDLDPQVQDIRILQKVNAAHRGAFMEKFPMQTEHILRLLTERLQLGLDKRDGVDLVRVDSWKLLPEEILALSESIYYINQVRLTLQDAKQ
jgi:hypothetical protein